MLTNVQDHPTFSFTDRDECSLNTDHCEHNCINSVGSYTCTCDSGYELASDGLHCSGRHLY